MKQTLEVEAIAEKQRKIKKLILTWKHDSVSTARRLGDESDSDKSRETYIHFCFSFNRCLCWDLSALWSEERSRLTSKLFESFSEKTCSSSVSSSLHALIYTNRFTFQHHIFQAHTHTHTSINIRGIALISRFNVVTMFVFKNFRPHSLIDCLVRIRERRSRRSHDDASFAFCLMGTLPDVTNGLRDIRWLCSSRRRASLKTSTNFALLWSKTEKNVKFD